MNNNLQWFPEENQYETEWDDCDFWEDENRESFDDNMDEDFLEEEHPLPTLTPKVNDEDDILF